MAPADREDINELKQQNYRNFSRMEEIMQRQTQILHQMSQSQNTMTNTLTHMAGSLKEIHDKIEQNRNSSTTDKIVGLAKYSISAAFGAIVTILSTGPR